MWEKKLPLFRIDSIHSLYGHFYRSNNSAESENQRLRHFQESSEHIT